MYINMIAKVGFLCYNEYEERKIVEGILEKE